MERYCGEIRPLLASRRFATGPDLGTYESDFASLRPTTWETQQKWGEAKDKARDTWEDVKDKAEDIVDGAEDRVDEINEPDDEPVESSASR